MDTTALENELNEMIAPGNAMEAFEKFYADDVVMKENNQDPRKGKEACRKYEEEGAAKFRLLRTLHQCLFQQTAETVLRALDPQEVLDLLARACAGDFSGQKQTT
ncbi:MAG: hypothetical protein KJN97_03205 [Deltaproteobacteria bacterium]|nr:hypothetical protein [Deltaproteobacteria bacterium]